MSRATAVAAMLAALASVHAAPPQAGEIRLILAPTGNEAKFKVREQLAMLSMPNDAVGTTHAITGALVLGRDGAVVSGQSRFTVDLATLQTDRDRRDRYIKARTLQVDSFPTAVLVPTRLVGLTAPLPADGPMTFQLVGDLTIHGVTKPTTWEVTATGDHGTYTGTATTHVKFEDFGMAQPRVAIVLSVQDDITLEYDFHLVPDTAAAR